MTVWTEFQEALRLELESTEFSTWFRIQGNPRKRTWFYATDLLPRIARRLNNLHEAEWLHIDHVFWGPEGNASGPRILIECENDSSDTTHEIRKLCSASAPLRVLIAVEKWDDGSDLWKGRGSGNREHLLKNWLEVRQSWHRDWPDRGFVAVVVGEWGPDDVVRFYACLLPVEGDVTGDISPFVSLSRYKR